MHKTVLLRPVETYPLAQDDQRFMDIVQMMLDEGYRQVHYVTDLGIRGLKVDQWKDVPCKPHSDPEVRAGVWAAE